MAAGHENTGKKDVYERYSSTIKSRKFDLYRKILQRSAYVGYVISCPVSAPTWGGEGEYAISHDVGWLVLLILMQGQCESLIVG